MPDYYQQNSKTYHEKTFFVDPASFLTPFVESLKQGATVLDIGCGSGWDLLWLKKRGFKVMGFERSPGLASLAGIDAGCEVIEGDFETYDFSDLQADAVLFAGSLVHVEPDKLANLLENITNGTQATVVYLSLKQGAGKKTGKDGRMFYLWDDKNLRKMFEKLGFQLVDSSKGASLVNPKDIWLGYVLEKP